jgi:ketosteroid isomerase-like protein
MPIPATTRALLLSVLLLPTAVLAQQSTQQSTPPSPDLSGTWFGTFTVTTPDKKVMHDTAVLLIDQPGPHPTGSIGATVDQQSPWTNAVADNNQLRFHLAAAGGLDVTLTHTEAHLTGTATGPRMNATLDLHPAPGLLPHDQLAAEITAADQQLYAAFTSCNVEQYAAFLSPNLEFYQDHTGLTNYQQNLDALRNRCAEGIHLRRELDKDTLIINAAPGAGAIQYGTQRFFSKNSDGTEHLDATARFTNIWTKATGTWKLTRIISFDHH